MTFTRKDIIRSETSYTLPDGRRFYNDGSDAGFMIQLLVDLANGKTVETHPCLFELE